MRSINTLFAGSLIALAGLAQSTQAAYFSFASDNDSSSHTWVGFGNKLLDADDPTDPQVLQIDDNNGPLPTINTDTEFEADFTMAPVQAVNVGGGSVLYVYRIDGTFSFNVGGNTLLSCSITNGTLTALGTAAGWSTTATIQANTRDADGASVVYNWFGPSMPGYFLQPGSSVGEADAAFTLTALHTLNGAPGVPTNSDHIVTDAYLAEGSFSGHADWQIPTPGTAALAGMGGLVMLRRRRSN